MAPVRVFFRGFNWAFDRLSLGYGGLTRRVLRVSAVMLVLYAGLVALAGWQFQRTPTGFIPEQDQGYFITVVQLPPGSALSRTDEVIRRLSQDLLQIAQTRLAAAVARRRDLVMELVDLIVDSEIPTLLEFEDLQWADDLTLEILAEVVRRYRRLGLPIRAVLSDNGPEYKARAFTAALAAKGIAHVRIPARSPNHNAVCERFHGTVLQECWRPAFHRRLFTSARQLQAEADAWLVHYNTRRRNHSDYMHGRTPAHMMTIRRHKKTA